MNKLISRRFLSLLAAGVVGSGVGSALAKPPTAAEALGLSPVQKDITYDQPKAAEIAKCTIKSEAAGKLRGFVVYDENGQVLRRFLDTDGDNSIDQWCYFRDGVEVYRDIDGDGNGKADQYRWLGTGGTRWGIDKDEDTKIDSWKQISAEEVTEEIVAALRTKDAARFKRVLLTADELASLGLPAEKATELERLIGDAGKDFAQIAAKQKTVASGAKWMSFGGGKPGLVPAASASGADLIVYDNVAVVVESDGKHAQVPIGTLVQVNGGWRAIDVPRSLDDPEASPVAGHFFQGPLAHADEGALAGGIKISPEMQKLLTDLEKLDKELASASDIAKINKLNASRADLLERIIVVAPAQEKDTWMRQYAESVTAAAQTGTFPDGAQRLKKLIAKLSQDPGQQDLLPFLGYRALQIDYQMSLKDAKNEEISKIAQTWLDGLEKLVSMHGDSESAAEPMLALAQEYEIHGREADAIKQYARIVKDFKDSDFAQKALGGKMRLESIGNRWMISGPSIDGKGNLTAAQLAGKVVLVQYWATWADQCKADFDTLKKLQAKYGKQGFQVIGVNLDTERADALKTLKAAALPWPTLYEPGGFDSRYANEMGVFSLPLMILIDKQGKVVSRNIVADELDEELKKMLK